MGAKVEENKDDIKLPAAEGDDIPPEGYTSEEWNDLSQAEREGIRDSLTNPEDIGDGEKKDDLSEDDLKKIAGEEDTTDDKNKKPSDKDGGQPPDGGSPPDNKDNPPDVSPPDKKPDEQINDENAVSDEDLLSYRPVVTAEEIKHTRVVPEELQKKLDELDTKYEDGEITQKQYNNDRDDIRDQIAEHNNRLRESTKEELAWQKEQKYFLDAKPEYLRAEGDSEEVKLVKTVLFNNLSSMVATLSADPKYSHLTGMQLLIKADKMIVKVKEAYGFGKKSPVQNVKPDVDDDKGKKKPPVTLPDHKTLSNVPPAGSNDTLDDSFAQLDKLSGEAYETALERLKPEVREAYLNRA